MASNTIDTKPAGRAHLTLERIRKMPTPTGPHAYFFDDDPKQLCVRVTCTGAKSYCYRGKLAGDSLRITIGSTDVWNLDDARTEARRLQTLIDEGTDPRQAKAELLAAKLADAEAKATQAARESVTVGSLWPDYLADRKPHWGDLHYRDHVRAMHIGGEKRARSIKLTEPGPLAVFANVRLLDMTPERVTEWAKTEATKRPARARLALRHLRAFLFWCAEHPAYKGIVTGNAAQAKGARESLGRPKVKNDLIQREQLPAWFAAVRQIHNPVIAAYLQTLLLTGARREEVAKLKWADVDFQWNSLKLADKIDDFRMVPLTPYVKHLLAGLPRRSEWVFSSPTAAGGYVADPRTAHNEACAVAGLVMTLHGLRRSFATLCEWTETPSGIAAQIQGHAPQGVREQNYIRRPLDLLRMWHCKIEGWILEQAGVTFQENAPALRVVKNTA